MSMPAANGRNFSTSFSIGHNGYVSSGASGTGYFSDLWKWDQTTNTWTQLANYPGMGDYAQSSFAIGGKGYVGLGQTGSTIGNDLWAYDTTSNSWTSKAVFPGAARYSAFGFSVGTDGFVGCGSSGSAPYHHDVWKYNSLSDTWTQLSNYPGGNREGLNYFTIGHVAYIGNGWDGSMLYSDFWQYNSSNDSWTTLPPTPIANGVGSSAAFAIGSNGYVCAGCGSSGNTRTFFKLDTMTKTWSTLQKFGGVSRCYPTGFSINGKGYVSAGTDSLGNQLFDLWEYSPPTFAGIRETVVNAFIISVYPNPSSGLVYFNITGHRENDAMLNIIDLQGRLVHSLLINKSTSLVTFDGSILDRGVYFYQFISEEKILSTGKLVLGK